MSVERSNELPPGTVEDALVTYGCIQRARVEALYNLHRAVFAESLVATLLSGAELSPDPAHDFDIKWRTAGSDISIEVKCFGRVPSTAEGSLHRDRFRPLRSLLS